MRKKRGNKENVSEKDYLKKVTPGENKRLKKKLIKKKSSEKIALRERSLKKEYKEMEKERCVKIK